MEEKNAQTQSNILHHFLPYHYYQDFSDSNNFSIESIVEDVVRRIRPSPGQSFVHWHEVVQDLISSGWNSGLVSQSAPVRAHVLALGAVQSEDQRLRAVSVLHQKGDPVVAGLVHKEIDLVAFVRCTLACIDEV